jgi:hypothetical protein
MHRGVPASAEFTQHMQKAVAQSLQINIPHILKRHSRNTERLFFVGQELIEARDVDAP